MNKLFTFVSTTAQVRQINEGLGDDGHIYSALHVINKSTVSQENFKILHHSQNLPNIQARKLLKHKFLVCSFNGPSSALDKAFQPAHGPAIWVWLPKCLAYRMIQNYEHESVSNSGQYAGANLGLGRLSSCLGR